MSLETAVPLLYRTECNQEVSKNLYKDLYTEFGQMSKEFSTCEDGHLLVVQKHRIGHKICVTFFPPNCCPKRFNPLTPEMDI